MSVKKDRAISLRYEEDLDGFLRLASAKTGLDMTAIIRLCIRKAKEEYETTGKIALSEMIKG